MIILLTQKLVSIIEVLAQALQGNLYEGATRALTHLIQRRIFARHARLIEAVKVR